MDEIFFLGTGFDAVFGWAAGLIAGFDWLQELGGAFVGVVVTLQLTLLCQ